MAIETIVGVDSYVEMPIEQDEFIKLLDGISEENIKVFVGIDVDDVVGVIVYEKTRDERSFIVLPEETRVIAFLRRSFPREFRKLDATRQPL